MVRYPHTVTITSTGTNSTQDSQGNWQTLPPSSTVLKGKWEPNAGSRMITSLVGGADGTVIVYEGVIYLRKANSAVIIGANVVVDGVVNGVSFRVAGTIKNFSFGQLSTRIWI
jgi:hypothetical protein